MTQIATLDRPAPEAVHLVPRTIALPSQTRAATITTADAKARTVDLVWSTGAGVLRYDWWDAEYFHELLDMSPQACDMARLNAGAPVLDTHQRYELENVIGVVERAWIEKGVGYATVRFSQRDDVTPIWQDVLDGVIRNVSVGYDITEMTDDGFDPTDGYRVMRATRWAPFEISMVPVGADAAAGTRSQQTAARTTCVVAFRQPAAPAAISQDTTMTTVTTAAPAGATNAGNDNQALEASRIEVVNGVREAEIARCRDIAAVGEQHGYRDLAQKFIAEGKSADAFRNAVLESIRNKQAENTSNGALDIGMTDAEVRNYSISRAILAAYQEQRGEGAGWKAAGFERECHEAVIKHTGREPKHAGILVPFDVQRRRQIAVQPGQLSPAALNMLAQQRDLTVGTTTAGGFLVQTQNLAASFIEMLRARTISLQLGALLLSGLRDSVTIPKQSAAATFYWLANEATAITESQQTLAQVSLAPKNGGAYTEISHQLMLQSAPAADMMVMNDLTKVCAIGVDTAIINGSGASGQPTGVNNTAGIGSVTGTSIAYAGIVEFQTDVGTANALTTNCAYATTPAVAGLLKQRQRFTSTDTPLWQGNLLDGTVEGFRAVSSTVMPSASMLFGDWSQIVVGEWGGLELQVNPFANFTAGIVGVRAWVTVDVGVRQAGAFSLATSIT